MTDQRQTQTVDEAAAILGIGRNSAHEAIRRSGDGDWLVKARKRWTNC